MAEEFKGTIPLISGLTPANNGTHPLVNAKDIQVGTEDDRLDVIIQKLKEQILDGNVAVFG